MPPRHSRGGYALTRKPPGDAFGLAGHLQARIIQLKANHIAYF